MVTGEAYTGLICPGYMSCAQWWCNWVDSHVFFSSGLVAQCDPGVVRDGEHFPTIMCVNRFGSNKGSDADALEIGSLLRNHIERFGDIYLRALTESLNFDQYSGIALNHWSGVSERYLRMKVAAPFFWIEPTCVTHYVNPDLPANKYGFGALCGTMEPKTVALTEGVVLVDQAGIKSLVDVKWRTARTNLWTMYLLNHHLGGLEHVKVKQADSDAFFLTGLSSEYDSVRDAMISGADLTRYHWEGGDCPLSKPAELGYIGGYLRLILTHCEMEGKFLINTHCFTYDDLKNGHIRISANRVRYMHKSSIGSSSGKANRAWCPASAMLSEFRVSGVDTIVSFDYNLPMFGRLVPRNIN